VLGATIEKARRPFADEKNSAYHVLQSVAGHGWGASALARVDGFLEWILDRRGTTKEEREWRYAIVQRVAAHGDLSDDGVRDDIEGWLRQGPHYRRGVTGDMEVATMTA